MSNDNETIIKVQESMRAFRSDQLGAMLTTCHRIMDNDESVLARETARILRLQILAEFARRGETKEQVLKRASDSRKTEEQEASQ